MKMQQLALVLLAGLASACNSEPTPSATTGHSDSTAKKIRLDTISYQTDTTRHQGFVAYDENQTGRRPVVLVVHEWWGLNDYAKMRAQQLAELGYLAFAVDMFGNQRQGTDPTAAQALVEPFYKDPSRARQGIDAALARIGSHELADTTRVAAIGYCFGGYIVLNAAKLGSNLRGVVSFHGDLTGAPVDRNQLKAAVLVLHGDADQFVPQAQLEAFRKSMDSVGANYTVKTYANATHAFTNPASTETGRKFNLPLSYDAKADSSSWMEMKNFLSTVLK